MANIQTSNPYEMNPDFDGEDVQCTKENPCGECDYCTDKDEPLKTWEEDEGEIEDEYIQQMADRFGVN